MTTWGSVKDIMLLSQPQDQCCPTQLTWNINETKLIKVEDNLVVSRDCEGREQVVTEITFIYNWQANPRDTVPVVHTICIYDYMRENVVLSVLQ